MDRTRRHRFLHRSSGRLGAAVGVAAIAAIAAFAPGAHATAPLRPQPIDPLPPVFVVGVVLDAAQAPGPDDDR